MQIVGAYLAIQLVRQIPLTPGGVGVVEASLLVALVALGTTSGTAAAVVLIYRLLSTWLLIPVGLLAWAGLRPGQQGIVEDDPAGPETPRTHRETEPALQPTPTAKPSVS